MAESQFTVGGQNPFTWLGAGSTCEIQLVQAAGGTSPDLQVLIVMVEDFGQLGPGEEYGAAPNLELPVFLFPAGQGP